jgi:predicted Zn-ribbon and HTH transcriptional regulator
MSSDKNTKETFEVILQAFSSSVTDDQWVEFTCPHCSSEVTATPKVQAQLVIGGIGHKCPGCDRYYALINCPNCKNVAGFDDIEWDQVLTEEGGHCPNCSANLIVRDHFNVPVVTTSIPVPNLSSWCEDKRDREFVTFLSSKLTGNAKIDSGIYHRTTGDRIKAAEQALAKIKSLKIKGGTVLSNVNGSISKVEKEANEVSPTGFELNTTLFNFINNLRSALDILSQELSNAYLTGEPENRVEFLKISKIITKAPPALVKYIEDFQQSQNYQYLNRLRNATQHRRLPLLQELGRFDLKHLNSIRPTAIRPTLKVYLPDNPYVKLDQVKFNANNELIETLDNLYSEVKEFILNVYEQAQ